MTEKRMKHYNDILTEVAKQSSTTERRADEAEREVEKLKKAEYMSYRIGQIFDGVISSITAWGLYIELPNTIEGLVHVNNLEGDYFTYDEKNYEMISSTGQIVYKLGQRVKVKCIAADTQLRTIDFKLVTK